MRESRVHFAWKEKAVHQQFRTGVSLHSHTLHSKECLDFIGRATANTPWLSGAIRKQMDRYRRLQGKDVDLSRAWWTSPVSAMDAWNLETLQIRNQLGLNPLISITDHDNIDAGLHLSMLSETRDCPISVEWTVPWRQTFFHIGVHNLPKDEAIAIMNDLETVTDDPAEEQIRAMLARLHSSPGILTILNHPLWDEGHIGAARHLECVRSMIAANGEFLHALELNGLRPWKENRDSALLARACSLPVISGGDRHGREPNANINLTNAATFAEFVEEVRHDGWSDVLFMPQYQEPLKLRIVQNMCDILEDAPAHSLGRVHWSDRVFYHAEDGEVKSLKELWGKKFPSVVNQFVGLMTIARSNRIQSALRVALSQKQEFAI